MLTRLSHPSRPTVIAGATFGFLLAAVSLAAPGRFGLTVDSGEYLGVAKGLLHGHGLTMAYSSIDEAYRAPGPFGQRVPLTQFPPLYPALIALVSAVVGVSTYAAAIAINTVAFAWAGSRLGLVVLRRGALALVAFLAALVSLPILEPALMVWAEPLKLALLTECGLALAAVVRVPNARTDRAVARSRRSSLLRRD